MAIDIKCEGQTVLGEGGRQEVEAGEQILGVIDGGPGADARAVIQKVEQRVVSFISGEPAVGRGIQLPEHAAAEGGEEFTDQRRTETMGELTIILFIAARMRVQPGLFGFARNATGGEWPAM